jgi:hypothetical protein
MAEIELCLGTFDLHWSVLIRGLNNVGSSPVSQPQSGLNPVHLKVQTQYSRSSAHSTGELLRGLELELG